MQIRTNNAPRAPTRLDFNKENLNSKENQPIQMTKLNKQKVQHSYETHLPTVKVQKQLFEQHLENQQQTISIKVTRQKKSLSLGSINPKKLIEDVRKRLSTEEYQKNQQLMRLRKIHLGNQAYIPITFNELKQTIKKRVSKHQIINL